ACADGRWRADALAAPHRSHRPRDRLEPSQDFSSPACRQEAGLLGMTQARSYRKGSDRFRQRIWEKVRKFLGRQKGLASRQRGETKFLVTVQRNAPRCILINRIHCKIGGRRALASVQPRFEGTNSETNSETAVRPQHTIDDIEIQEWLESLDSVLQTSGPEVAAEILERLRAHATVNGIDLPFSANTPYANTVPARLQPLFPGDQELERRIKSLVRWNALSMVVRANRIEHNIGGHISTYASAATLYEVGFNHFFRARTEEFEGDIVYFQGHASPGIYARAFIEGRISAEQLENFRRELKPGGGLSSYPHPWLMPDFWEFPTVSMCLSPLMAIYQA